MTAFWGILSLIFMFIQLIRSQYYYDNRGFFIPYPSTPLPLTPTTITGGTHHNRMSSGGIGVYNNVPVPRNDMFVNYDWEADDFTLEMHNDDDGIGSEGDREHEHHNGEASRDGTPPRRDPNIVYDRPMIRLPVRRPDYYVDYKDEDENMFDGVPNARWSGSITDEEAHMLAEGIFRNTNEIYLLRDELLQKDDNDDIGPITREILKRMEHSSSISRMNTNHHHNRTSTTNDRHSHSHNIDGMNVYNDFHTQPVTRSLNTGAHHEYNHADYHYHYNFPHRVYRSFSIPNTGQEGLQGVPLRRQCLHSHTREYIDPSLKRKRCASSPRSSEEEDQHADIRARNRRGITTFQTRTPTANVPPRLDVAYDRREEAPHRFRETHLRANGGGNGFDDDERDGDDDDDDDDENGNGRYYDDNGENGDRRGHSGYRWVPRRQPRYHREYDHNYPFHHYNGNIPISRMLGLPYGRRQYYHPHPEDDDFDSNDRDNDKQELNYQKNNSQQQQQQQQQQQHQQQQQQQNYSSSDLTPQSTPSDPNRNRNGNNNRNNNDGNGNGSRNHNGNHNHNGNDDDTDNDHNNGGNGGRNGNGNTSLAPDRNRNRNNRNRRTSANGEATSLPRFSNNQYYDRFGRHFDYGLHEYDKDYVDVPLDDILAPRTAASPPFIPGIQRLF